MARVLITLLVLVGAVVAAVVGDRPPPPADFTYIDNQPAFTLDPQRCAYEQDLRIVGALYDALVRWDPYTFDILPGIAERWTVSDDARTYTFHIREDARWSNGDPIVAADIVYSWRRAVMPDTAADYAKALFPVKGAEAFFRFRADQLARYASLPAAERTPQAAQALLDEALAAFDDLVGLRAPDPRTLVVTLEEPTLYFLDLCAFPALSPVHPPTVERWVTIDPDSGRLDQRHDWTKPPLLVSSGAYTLAEWRFKRDMRLVRNPLYWNAASVPTETIEIRVVEDPATAILAYQTGAADWLTDVLVDYLPEIIESGDPALHGASRFGTYSWNFNCTPTLTGGRANPFHDPRVRRAFAMAIDRDAIVQKVRRVGEDAAHNLIPPGSIDGYDTDRSVQGVRFDPAAARALLAEAGWAARDADGAPQNSAGEPFPVVEMLCSTGSYHQNVALAMGSMFLENLGVRTRIVQKESKAYRDDLRRRDYMLARGGWFGDHGDPTSFLDIHITGDGNNDRGYSNPAYDALLARARVETNPDRRLQVLEDAEALIVESDVPILPIWTYRQFYMYDPARVRGVSAHPRMLQRLEYLSVDSEGARP